MAAENARRAFLPAPGNAVAQQGMASPAAAAAQAAPAAAAARQRQALGLEGGVTLGRAMGQTQYMRGATVGEHQDFITRSQKTTGRDPGQFVYRNPLKHPEFANKGFEPRNLVDSINGKGPAGGQTMEASQALALKHLAKLRQDGQGPAKAVLSDDKGGIFKTSNAKLVHRAQTEAAGKGLAKGSPEFDQEVVRLLAKDRPSLAKAYEAAGGSNHDRPLPDPTRADLCKHFNALDQAGRREFMHFALIGHASQSVPVLGEVYMIKGDFAEKDLSKFGKFINFVTGKSGEVRISAQLAQGKFSNPLAAWGYRTFAGSTRQDANQGVVKEAMATDIARMLGRTGADRNGPAQYATQIASVDRGQWQDGSPKLMLRVKLLDSQQAQQEVGGPVQAGARYKDLEGRIVDGRVVESYYRGSDALPEKIAISKETGKPKTSLMDRIKATFSSDVPSRPVYRETPPAEGIRNLSAMIIKTGIALGDRDALGGSGANKGSVGRVAGVIDPGHAWETAPLAMNDDFTFTQPGGGDYQKKMKNFSLGDSAPLADKMRAVRDLQHSLRSGEADGVFAAYRDQFPEYAQTIDEAQARHLQALESLVGDDVFDEDDNRVEGGIFTDRLKLFEYAFGPNADQQIDRAFNILDNLEKLTSESAWTSENGLVALARPRIVENADGFQRTKWNIREDGDNVVFSADVSRHDAQAKLATFVNEHRSINARFGTDELGNVTLTVRKSDLTAVSAWASDDRVLDAVARRTDPQYVADHAQALAARRDEMVNELAAGNEDAEEALFGGAERPASRLAAGSRLFADDVAASKAASEPAPAAENEVDDLREEMRELDAEEDAEAARREQQSAEAIERLTEDADRMQRQANDDRAVGGT